MWWRLCITDAFQGFIGTYKFSALDEKKCKQTVDQKCKQRAEDTSNSFELDKSNFELTQPHVHPHKPNFELTQTPSKSLNFKTIWPETRQTQAQIWKNRTSNICEPARFAYQNRTTNPTEVTEPSKNSELRTHELGSTIHHFWVGEQGEYPPP